MLQGAKECSSVFGWFTSVPVDFGSTHPCWVPGGHSGFGYYTHNDSMQTKKKGGFFHVAPFLIWKRPFFTKGFVCLLHLFIFWLTGWLCAWVCSCACVCVMCVLHMCVAYGDQKRTSGPLKLELQVFMSHPVWVLGTKPWSDARAISPAPPKIFLITSQI